MDNLELLLPEIFISLSIMFLLILGVFKRAGHAILLFHQTWFWGATGKNQNAHTQ